MIGVLGGLGAAFSFACAVLCSSRSSRMIGPASVLSWVMLVGLILTAPAALVTGSPEGLDRSMMSGERPGVLTAVLLTGIVLGVALATAARDESGAGASGTSGTSGAPHAIVAALLFGASLYATARARADLPVPWVLLPARFIGVLAVGVPLAMTARCG